MREHNYMGVATIASKSMAENVFYCLFLDQNIRISVLKNESTVSMSPRGGAPKLIKASLE